MADKCWPYWVLKMPMTCPFFNRFWWYLYQNSWFIELFLIKHTYHYRPVIIAFGVPLIATETFLCLSEGFLCHLQHTKSPQKISERKRYYNTLIYSSYSTFCGGPVSPPSIVLFSLGNASGCIDDSNKIFVAVFLWPQQIGNYLWIVFLPINVFLIIAQRQLTLQCVCKRKLSSIFLGVTYFRGYNSRTTFIVILFYIT